MRFRLQILLALAVAMSGAVAARPTPNQTAQDPGGVQSLLLRLERIIQAADSDAYVGLLAESANRQEAQKFITREFIKGMTRVAVREREREPLTGTLPGNGYRVSVDVFEEFGARARTTTWLIDLKKVGTDGEDAWRIADQQRLSVVEDLYRLSLNPGKQFKARNLTFAVEDLDLTLADGTVFPIDIDQGTTGVVLLGRGELHFHPTPEVEKGQLKIFCGAEVLQTRFEGTYIRMNPADASRLLASDRLTPEAVNPQQFRRADELFREEVAKSYAVDLSDLSRDLWSLVPAVGDLLTEMRTPRYGTLTYTHSGSEPEDLSFFDRKRHKNIAVYASQQTLARRGPTYNEDELASYDVLDYDLDIVLTPDRQWIEGKARLQLRVQALAITSMTLRLAEPLVVQSIVSNRFGRLFGIRVRNQNTVIVNLPATMFSNDEMTLTITYAGRLEPQREDSEGAAPGQNSSPQLEDLPILQPERSYLYSNRSYWYPQATVTDYATARLRITVPGSYDCVASGELSEGFPAPVETKDGSIPRKIYEFTTSKPLRYLAFVVSRFVRSEPTLVPFDSGPALNLSVQANPRQVRRGRDLAQRARDIVQFYQSIVGECPYPSFTLAIVESELPGGHSPGFFAALNQPLPNTPYVWRNDPASFDDFPEFFLAHELAHQWWGQAVGWRNYHEQWISEGFAQYFAALYAQHRRGDETFANMLRQFRRWGLRHSDQGPISLGYRLGHIRGDSRIFRALVYNKSAAVLHMLRRLIGDDAFFRGLRRFYESSLFHKVGTDDVRAAMEAESGRSLQRFFDRWINGSALPNIRFGYRVEPGPFGQQALVRIEQIGDLFDVPVTLVVQYTDRKEVQVLVPVTERVVDVPIPLTGTLRTIEVSKDDGTVAEVAKS